MMAAIRRRQSEKDDEILLAKVANLYRLERDATVCFVQVTGNSNNLLYRLEVLEVRGLRLEARGRGRGAAGERLGTKAARSRDSGVLGALRKRNSFAIKNL